MEPTKDPDQLIAGFALAGLLLAVFWRLLHWVRDAPVKPEPWSAEIEESLHTSGATPVCHRCLTPHHAEARFCDQCGAAVGHYNNLMPYVIVFSQGEVLRNGVTDRIRVGPLTILGYLLYSTLNYFIFAPVYWFFFFKNLQRIRMEDLQRLKE